jgi:hypothetical protein
MPYTIEFAESVKVQFHVLTVRQRSTILDAIGKQLVHEPQVVHILAVGQKRGNRLLIGGVEVQL